MAESTEELRERWTHLYKDHLPALARSRDPVQAHWPVSLDHCFARIVLDNAVGVDRPWSEVVKSPATRNMTACQFRLAIELAEMIATGQRDLALLDEESLRLRGKRSKSKSIRRFEQVGNGKSVEKRKAERGDGYGYSTDATATATAPATAGTAENKSPKKQSSGPDEIATVSKTRAKDSSKRRKKQSDAVISSYFTCPPKQKYSEPDALNKDAESHVGDRKIPDPNLISNDDVDMNSQLKRIADSNLTAFRKQMLNLLCQIPRGRFTTYQTMSDHISETSHKTCARAVGNAMRNNPFAPAVPCHRVLASDGSLGGFNGYWGEGGKFASEKHRLLHEEGVRFDSTGKVKGQPFRDFKS